ncbi:MAG: hypothetical protein U0935_24760 [Pirellulales bacterium]
MTHSTSAEIDAGACRVDLPVVDSPMQAAPRRIPGGKPDPRPLAEVLSLRNTPAETNDVILNGLGRLAATDQQIELGRHDQSAHGGVDVKSTNLLLPVRPLNSTSAV